MKDILLNRKPHAVRPPHLLMTAVNWMSHGTQDNYPEFLKASDQGAALSPTTARAWRAGWPRMLDTGKWECDSVAAFGGLGTRSATPGFVGMPCRAVTSTTGVLMTVSPRRAGRMVAGIALATSLAMTVSGCGGSSSGGSARGISLVHAGQLTACTHLPYKPFEFSQNGKVVGLDVSMVDLLARKLGVQTNVVNIGWAQVTSGGAFAARKCDVGMGAATITAKRAKSVKFSAPYFKATQALLVKSDSPYHGLADLKGKKLAVQTDTTGQLYANAHAKQYGYTTVVFDDSLSEFNGLMAGAVDAAINDNGPEYNFVNSNHGAKVTKEFDTGEHYGFMVKKNDKNAEKLVSKFNSVIAASKKDGQYDKIFKKWFGRLPNKGGAGE